MNQTRDGHERVKAAVIGVGIWGQNHALLYRDYYRSDLVLICDRNEERAKEIAALHGCDYTTEIEEVAHSDVDVVSIATPDFAHFEPALAMIEAGKHVLIEKPLTTDVDEARQLVQVAHTKKTKTMVNFQMRWSPAYMTIKQAIIDGKLGRPYMGYVRLSDAIRVAVEWFSWSGKSGPQWFLFPHTMDIMCWYLDQTPGEVYATGHKGVLESRGIDSYDSIQAQVRFDEGAVVTFETSWIVPDSSPNVVDCYLSLYGTEGKVELDADYAGLAIAADTFNYPWVPVGQRNMYGRLDHPIYEPIKYFIDCVIDDTTPAVGLTDGYITTAMIAATLESVEQGRPVPIRLSELEEE